MIKFILYVGIFFASISATAFTLSQMLRLKEMLEPRNQAVKPNKVNIRQ